MKLKIQNQIGWTLLGALLLMFAAIYNGFPLVTSDSGMYIYSGFQKFVPVDRPPGYGIFIRHSSLASSLWFTIISQAIILSYILWQTINKFVIDSLEKYEKFIIIIFLSALSSISWYTSQVMPDIFTPICILAFLLLIFSKNNYINNIFNSIILLAGCLVHNSNILIFSILAILLILYGAFSNAFKNKVISFGKSIFIFLLITSAWILSPALNYSIDGKFKLTGAPHVFFLAKYMENGILDRYLDKNCDKFLVKILPDSGLYFISAKHSNKFIDVEAASKTNGARVHQWEYLGLPNQEFKIIRVKNEWFKIVSQNSNKCLEAEIGDTSRVGRQIIQNSFTGKDNQLFKFKNTPDSNYFNVINKQSLKVLDVTGISFDNGAPIHEYNLTGNDNQKFRVIKYPHCLCMYKDDLPSSSIAFIWNPDSVFGKTGGWDLSKEEYGGTLNEIIFSFDYFGANMGESIIATLYQLTRNDIGDGIFGYDDKSSPFGAIKKHLPYELKPFSNSRENRGQLNFAEINKRNFWLLLFSVIVIFVFFQNKTFKRSISNEFALFIKLCLMSIVINAFVTGAMANVLDRLQSRVSWFIPLIAIILVFNFFSPRLKKLLDKEKLE
jgi:hypothetical protein